MAEPRSKVGISNREAPEQEARERRENPPQFEGEAANSGEDTPATYEEQSSTKIGTKASAEKQDSTRHTEQTAPAASKVQGAFGKESE